MLPRWTAGALLIAISCADSGGLVGPRGLARDDLVGTYVATAFLVTVGAEEIDVIDGGGVLFITLEPAGTTTGMLFVPEAVAGEEVTADLSGTWGFRAQGPTVTFEQTADTLVGDLTFLAACAEDGTIQLCADEIVLSNRFQVVLSRISTIQFPDTSCP